MKEPHAARPVILLDFTKREASTITLEEANRRMREQEARGVRLTCEGVSVPPRKADDGA